MTTAVEKEVNPHFEDFLFDWRCKTQLLVGGYGSSKSYHVALKILLKLLEEKRTALVVREVYDTHRDSTFSLFTEIIEDLGLSGKVKTSSSPMTVKCPNGSKIIFRGMDKPEKLKSINNISLIWLEECSEIKYAGFKELLGRLRHPTLDLFIILSTNPVSKGNWTYKHFFKNEMEEYFVLDDEELYKRQTIIVNNTYYHHSTADDNLFLPASYIEQLDEMALYDPDLHRIARKGRFGVNGILVLPQFETKPHDQVMNEIALIRKPIRKNGMDFGFVDSYNALLRMVVDHENKWLYIYWEYYKRGMTDDKTADELEEEGLKKSIIKADNAEPKTIAYYKQRGFRMFACKKLTRIENTKKMKRFKRIICSDACVNTIRELKELTFKKDPKTDEIIEDEFNIDPHTFSANNPVASAILTSGIAKGAPDSGYWYIITFSYGGGGISNIGQIAIAYLNNGSRGSDMRTRYRFGGEWSAWSSSFHLPAPVIAVLATGWYVNTGEALTYYKDGFGVVHVSGRVRRTDGNSSRRITTLPVGYRPTKAVQSQVTVGITGSGYVDIDINGNIDVWLEGSTNVSVLIDASFPTTV